MEQETNPIEVLDGLRDAQSALEETLKEIQKKIETLEKDAWMYGADRKAFGYIVVSCDSDSWKETKEMKYDRAFYIQDNFLGNDHYVTISKQEAMNLIEYMKEKIKYLEVEE